MRQLKEIFLAPEFACSQEKGVVFFQEYVFFHCTTSINTRTALE